MTKAKSHLLKHEVPPNVDCVVHFGTDDKKEIARLVAAMGQRQLQERFKAVYVSNTGSNNNNWLRRKLLEAAGCQEAKVVGMGNSSPRKKGVGIGELGMDGGASYRTENGMRRTKRPRKPKQDADYVGEDAYELGKQREGGPLSSGDAYLQERTAAYKASLAHSRLPSGHDYPYANIMLGKNFMVHHPFANAPPFHEVQWPQPSGMRKPDESNSSSEDQTAYEHSHSHHSHQSRDGHPVSPVTQTERILEGVMPLLANQPLSQTQLRMHASVPGMPGMPGPHWEDQLRGYPLTASAPVRFGGHPGSPNTYYPQMMHHQSGTQDERVGGNTPLLDMDDALMDGPMLGHSSAIDSFFPGGLPSLEGHLLPSVNNSPVFGADLYNMFMDSKDTGRPSQGLSMIDMPGRMSSLDHMLDASPSHMLNDARLHMPAAPPPTPVSHGLQSPRYPGSLEGMAAPSHRFTGAHLPSSFSTQHYGESPLAPHFRALAAPTPASPRVAQAPLSPRFLVAKSPTPASPRAAEPPRFAPSATPVSPRAGGAPRFASAAPTTPMSPRAAAAPASLTKQQRSSSVEPPENRMQLPSLSCMAVRTLSVPEPLPLDLHSNNNPSNLSSIHSVPSLGAWNTPEYSHLHTPASSPHAATPSRDSPIDLNMQAHIQCLLGAQLPSADVEAPSAPTTAGQMASPAAAQLPAQPDQAAAAPPAEKAAAAAQPDASMSGAKMAAQLPAESATLPTIAEEEPTRPSNPAEGARIESH